MPRSVLFCKICKDIIVCGNDIHDFRSCKCESNAIDGNETFCRILGCPSLYVVYESDDTITKQNTQCEKCQISWIEIVKKQDLPIVCPQCEDLVSMTEN